MRSVEEWIGGTDDAKIPARVRIRVFERYGGRCYRSNSIIRPGDSWDLDHIIALANGGEHKESNLAPVLKESHKVKSKEDRVIQSRIFKQKKKHLGLHKAKGRPMAGTKASGWRRTMSGKWVKRND